MDTLDDGGGQPRDFRWPLIGPHAAAQEAQAPVAAEQAPESDAQVIDEPAIAEASAWQTGFDAGMEAAQVQLEQEREARELHLQSALEAFEQLRAALDDALCHAVVATIERIVQRVVGDILNDPAAADAVRARVAEALARLGAAAGEVVLEVAVVDEARMRELLPAWQVRGVDDVRSPGFRLAHADAALQYDPHELLTAALQELADASAP